MPELLTKPQVVAAALGRGLDPAALRAVLLVETGGRGGFLPDGRVRILFERHKLWRRLQTRGIDPFVLGSVRPDLCGPHWDSHTYPYGTEAHQWDRVGDVIAFGKRLSLEDSYSKAAWEACSWGLLQVLGENYLACEFPNVLRFKAAQEASEAEQLATALRFMAQNGALRALQGRRWPTFARIWNGSGAVVAYSAKLLAAYVRAKASGW